MTIELLTQSVTIGGQSYRPSLVQITQTLGEVDTFSFDIDLDANSARSVPSVNDAVVVSQTVGENTTVVRGRIVSVNARRQSYGTSYQVECRGESDIAFSRRGLFIRPQAPLGTQVREVVALLWPSLGTTNLPSVGPILPEYASVYDSLGDYLNWVAEQTGSSWRVDDNQLAFFFHADAVPAGAIPLSGVDFQSNSVSVTSSLDIINQAQQQAWLYRTITAQAQIFVGVRCITSIPLPASVPRLDEGWELADARIDTGRSANPDQDVSQTRIRVTGDMVELHPPLHWSPTPVVSLVYRRLVWVQESDAASISQWGLRSSAPLPHDGAMDIDQARGHLRRYLGRMSLPTVTMSGVLLRADVGIGRVIRVSVDGITPARNMLVTSVRRNTIGTELEVIISAQTMGLTATEEEAVPVRRQASSSPIVELFRRTLHLESASLHPTNPSGGLAMFVGPIPPPNFAQAPEVRWNADLEANVSFADIRHLDVDWIANVRGSVLPEYEPTTLVDWQSDFGVVQPTYADVTSDYGWVSQFYADIVVPAQAEATTIFHWTAEFEGFSIGNPIVVDEEDAALDIIATITAEDDSVII